MLKVVSMVISIQTWFFTTSYKLKDIDQAYKDMDERKTIVKIMIVMD